MMSSWDGRSNPSFQVTHSVSFCVAPLTFELQSDMFPFSLFKDGLLLLPEEFFYLFF